MSLEKPGHTQAKTGILLYYICSLIANSSRLLLILVISYFLLFSPQWEDVSYKGIILNEQDATLYECLKQAVAALSKEFKGQYY